MTYYYPCPSSESSFFINGNIDKIAANRVVLSIFTEFALMNNYKPSLQQYNEVILNLQRITVDNKTTDNKTTDNKTIDNNETTNRMQRKKMSVSTLDKLSLLYRRKKTSTKIRK